MSLEFSQELDTPIVSPTFAPQDAGEIGLRPKLLSDYTGQEKAREISLFILKPPGGVENLWITPCCTALPVWAKPRWRALSPTKWA